MIFIFLSTVLLLHFPFLHAAECNYDISLSANQEVNVVSPGYPNYQYTPGSSCRFNIKVEPGYEIYAECSFNIPKPNSESCTTDYFFVSTNGDSSLYKSEYFCGYGSVTRSSVMMVIAHISTGNAGGYYSCKVKARPQPACDCGWSTTSKIVGGTNANVNEFPSMAGLVDLRKSSLYCGGAIINYRFILTAAHCLVDIAPSDIGALVGDHDISTGQDSPYAQLYSVASYMRHEKYNANTRENDIGLIKTTQDITFSYAVGPACLPFRYRTNLFAGAYVDAAGWGTTEFGGPRPSILQKVTLQATSNSYCSSQQTSTVYASQICTYTPGKDTCQFDSGGNLFYRPGRFYTVGVISNGVGCAQTTPSINTRVTSYLSWILANSVDAAYCNK